MSEIITELQGREIVVIPSYIDTYNAIILDYGTLGWLLKVTKVSLHEKYRQVGDVIFVQNINNFKLI